MARGTPDRSTDASLEGDVQIGAVEVKDGQTERRAQVNESSEIHAQTMRQGDLVDHSGTIANGGQSQQVMPPNPDRRYLLIQNVSSAELFVEFGTDAVLDQPSIRLAADGGNLIFEDGFIPAQALHVIGNTGGQAFTAKEGS